MGRLKIAIVGTGRIGQRHAMIVKQLADLIAVCDIKEDLANSVAQEFQCNPYGNIDDLIFAENAIDLVVVCTPNGLHKEHTIKALEAGCNVLCEKPMATSVRDCERMISEAEKANKRLFVVKQNRFNPPVVALKNAIDENRLGKIWNVQVNCFWNRGEEYYLESDWKGSKSLDGGTLFTQFSHFVDLLYWMVGDINKAYAITKNLGHKGLVDFEDTGVVAFEFDSGAIGTLNYTVNSHAKNMEGSLTVFGDKGTVKIGGQYLNVLEYQSIEDHKIQYLDENRPANEYGFYQGSMSNHDKVYENLIDVLTKGGSVMTNAMEGLKTVQIIERIYASADKIGSEE
jgi:predicted dehydrogenase